MKVKKKNGKVKWINAVALLLIAGMGCGQAGCGNSGGQDAWMQEGGSAGRQAGGNAEVPEDGSTERQEDAGKQPEYEKEEEEGRTEENAGKTAQKTQGGAVENSLERKRKVPAGSLELVPAELAVSERDTEEGTVAFIGSLEVMLPPGWELETRASEEGIEQ